MVRSAQNIVEALKANRRLIFADDYEVCVREGATAEKTFQGGELSALCERESLWIGLRVMHRKQPGRASVTADSPEALDALVNLAFDSSAAASADPWFRFPLWRSLPKTAAKLEENTCSSSALVSSPDIEEIHVTRSEKWQVMRKTEKLAREHRQSFRTQKVSSSVQHPFGVTRLQEDRVGIDGAGSQWAAQFESGLAQRKGGVEFVPRGQAPVILSAGAGSILLRGLGDWFCADRILLEESPLGEKLGQPIFSTAISVIDDGNLRGGVRSLPFDLEGVPTAKKKLVERGILRDLLHNAYTATRENRLSSGNHLWVEEEGRPILTHSNLYIEPGSESAEQWVSAMREGLLIDAVESFAPRRTGASDWELLAHGWAIMRGEKVAPVWNIRLRFDPLRFWGRASAVGNDLAFTGSTGCPSIFFENIPLG